VPVAVHRDRDRGVADVGEVRVFLAGLSDSAPPPRVWEELARRKLPEIERKLAETQAIEQMLEAGLECQCMTLQDCLGWVAPFSAS
jgi:MerR family transcriptional regulator, redox-sensitive transcriptional activator SoxR